MIRNVQIDYSLDRASADSLIHDVQASRPGEPIKLRLQPQLLAKRKPDPERSIYYAWKGVHWNAECKSVREVLDLRAALAGLFAAVSAVGAKPVIAMLGSLIQVHVKSATSAAEK